MKKFTVTGNSKDMGSDRVEPFSIVVVAADSVEAESAAKDDLYLHNRELVDVVKVEEK